MVKVNIKYLIFKNWMAIQHPVHMIIDGAGGALSPSAFIPFCEFGGFHHGNSWR